MNKLILIISVLVVFWSQAIDAQSYFEQNDCWTEASTCVTGCNGGFQIYHYQCFVDKDSIISGKVFKKNYCKIPRGYNTT